MPRKIHIAKLNKKHGKKHPPKAHQRSWWRFYYWFKGDVVRNNVNNGHFRGLQR